MVCQKREIPRLIRQVLTCVLCLMFAVCVGACKEKTPPPPPPPTVTVAQPVERTVTDYLELTGNTQAIKTVQLVARVLGLPGKGLLPRRATGKRGSIALPHPAEHVPG